MPITPENVCSGLITPPHSKREFAVYHLSKQFAETVLPVEVGAIALGSRIAADRIIEISLRRPVFVADHFIAVAERLQPDSTRPIIELKGEASLSMFRSMLDMALCYTDDTSRGILESLIDGYIQNCPAEEMSGMGSLAAQEVLNEAVAELGDRGVDDIDDLLRVIDLKTSLELKD